MNEAMGIVVGAAITAVPTTAGVWLTLLGAARQAQVSADALRATTQMQIDGGREAVRRQVRRDAGSPPTARHVHDAEATNGT
ncbi:MAG TPA: hypothetical protein VLH10_22110 [Yinghuangia sp.]|nr:hypothetical protein [Yinghuangia sp.]